MAGSRFFNADPLTGVTRFFHPSDDGESFVIETKQDVTDVVQENKAMHAGLDERMTWKGDMHHVARIPNVVYWDLKRRGILEDEKALRKWLNDPDNRAFRLRPGRV
jgi:hypothetical protein